VVDFDVASNFQLFFTAFSGTLFTLLSIQICFQVLLIILLFLRNKKL